MPKAKAGAIRVVQRLQLPNLTELHYVTADHPRIHGAKARQLPRVPENARRDLPVLIALTFAKASSATATPIPLKALFDLQARIRGSISIVLQNTDAFTLRNSKFRAIRHEK
jgi:hypothetical protein